jgi:hypothetical protein
MKTIFTILFTLLSFFSFSQDSIFHTSGTISSGLITNVSNRYISWKEKTSTHTLPLSMTSGFKRSGILYKVIDGRVYSFDSYKKESDYLNKNLKYYNVQTTSIFNLRKGNNRIMAGAFFIILSGATSITHFLIKDASPDIHTTLTIAAVTFNMTGGAFILSGARKNKKESEKIRFIRDK